MVKAKQIAEKFIHEHSLDEDEYRILIDERNDEITEFLRRNAVSLRKKIYGKDVYIRGLIEISNYCKNDCFYCGIRRSNKMLSRYRLEPDEIIECACKGYELGFRTAVLQGGEDGFFSDEVITGIVRSIKKIHPDMAITLSLGERSKESYKKLFEAGADRYLLRHETADKEHYQKLHPLGMSYENRIRCLHELKETGFQTGCGFMVGSPFQTSAYLARDLKFIEKFKPAMCGIGPFIPQHGTPFKDETQGSLELTCFLLSVIRIIHPNVLLPATTALGSIDPNGREKGILSGANVVMPNLSPESVRTLYAIYDNKLATGVESAEGLSDLNDCMQKIGYKITVARGDAKH